VPAPYGAPVSALKQFLQRVPAEATWLGVDVAAEDAGLVRGLRVVSLVPNGPAGQAGLRPGKDSAQADVIVAVDGSPVTTPPALNEAVRARTAGDQVELLVFGMGRYRTVSVKPRPAPELTTPPTFTAKPPAPPTPNPYR
jgi:S1-C subfamily serine protease